MRPTLGISRSSILRSKCCKTKRYLSTFTYTFNQQNVDHSSANLYLQPGMVSRPEFSRPRRYPDVRLSLKRPETLDAEIETRPRRYAEVLEISARPIHLCEGVSTTELYVSIVFDLHSLSSLRHLRNWKVNMTWMYACWINLDSHQKPRDIVEDWLLAFMHVGFWIQLMMSLLCRVQSSADVGQRKSQNYGEQSCQVKLYLLRLKYKVNSAHKTWQKRAYVDENYTFIVASAAADYSI